MRFGDRGNGRVEALSDGVIGVAITLLVLNLMVDPGTDAALTTELRERWPAFAAYGASFVIVGALWLNHYHLFRMSVGVDRRVMIYNLALLGFVTALPFTTWAYAGYVLGGGANARTAAILYGVVMEGIAIAFLLILLRLLRKGLIDDRVPPEQTRRLLFHYRLRVAIYLLIIVVGVINPAIMLVLYLVIIGFSSGPLLRALEFEPAAP